MNSVTRRIQGVRAMLRLSVADMGKAMGCSEAEYLALEEEESSSVVEYLSSHFNVRREYILEGSGAFFVSRSLPIETIIQFRDARHWKQFHNPKDLAISLSLEASELLECFQWSGGDVACSEKHHEMEEELADIIIYAVQFADAIGVDIPTIIHEKLLRNNERYPEAKAMDSSKKYKEL